MNARNAGRLEGKTALVMGAGASADGMSNGRAVAVLFAREGARVFAVDNSADNLAGTRSMIETEGGSVECFIADITRFDEVEAAVRRCVEVFGGISVLHNNIGIAGAGGVTAISFDQWDRQIDANLKGAMFSCRAVLPVMEKAGAGSIVNVSSLLSHLALRKISNVAYSVSKAGLEQLTRVIAVEYAPKGIRANNLVLGLIDTPQVRGAYERRRARQPEEADRIWFGRSQFAPC